MARTVAEGMWEMLAAAGVRRCYGIVGDALNPVIDALRRNGSVDFVHVRHEEYGVFAAVAEARLTGNPVAVCGTAGPGVTHLINGLLDARKERVPVIAIAGDVESSLLDSDALEELNPYKFFDTAALYIGRLVNPGQLRPMVSTAITTAVAERGPVVISLPGDVAVADAPSVSLRVPLPATTIGAASAADLAAMADLINQAETVAIFGGDGCAQAQDEVRELAARLKAPVGYSFKGKPWLEHDNPNAVGMTGLLGYGGCHAAINSADVLLMLGTDFPFTDFLPHKKVKTIQVDRDPGHIGRRAPLELGVVGDVAATLRAWRRWSQDKHGDHFLREHVRRPSTRGGGSGTTSPRDPASSRSGRSTSPPSCPSWPTTTRSSPWTPARPASGPPGKSSTAATAGCSARSPGHPWPTPRRTPSAPRWPSPGGRPSPCAATAASPCSGWATC